MGRRPTEDPMDVDDAEGDDSISEKRKNYENDSEEVRDQGKPPFF